jgi:protein-disulfide isomerase
MTHLILPVGARDHTLGPSNAPVVLMEYGQYECSHCALVVQTVEVLRQRLNGALCFAYRHFPPARLDSGARRAAEAAEAAGAQGKFWEMHGLLFEHTSHLDDATLALCAATVGLDMPRFLDDLKQGIYAAKVREDFEGGLRSGISSTPTFFINGIRHDDYGDADTLLAAIQRQLADQENGRGVYPRERTVSTGCV